MLRSMRLVMSSRALYACNIKLLCSKIETRPSPKTFRNYYSKVKSYVIVGLVPVIPSVDIQNESKEESDKRLVISQAEEPVNEDTGAESGWDRLKAVFEIDEFGNLSKELTATLQATMMAFISGCIFGGFSRSRSAFMDFMERNQATIFEQPFDAKKRLQNHVTIHFGKGAISWAIKLSIFTGGFMLFLTSTSAYRGKTSYLDYASSGAAVGALLRIKHGPRAIIMGGVVAGTLGLICGLMTKTLLSLYGTSFDDIIAFQYEIDKRRKNLYKENYSKGFKSEIGAETYESLKNRPSGEDRTL